jgi:hypothetical protein
MSHYEAIHELYKLCSQIDFVETAELMAEAGSDEERSFIAIVTDFVLQQKQKEVISQNRF